MGGAPEDIGDLATKTKLPNTKERKSRGPLLGYGKSLAFVGFISLGLILSLFLTISNQYIPKNTITTVLPIGYPVNRSIDMITVTREPLILVPFKSLLPGNMVYTTLEVVIYHHKNNTMNVQKVTLSSLPGSILNYSRFINSSMSANRNVKVDDYVLNLNTKHNLEIGNMSNRYQLSIFYTDPKNPPISISSANITNNTGTSIKNTKVSHTAQQTPNPNRVVTHIVRQTPNPNLVSQYYYWTFTWPIKTLDLTTLTYFWIVLIGVILSKLSTRVTKNTSSPIGTLSNYDYLWIGISAIIALLIFSSFQQQVHLTGNILYNISLAFAFGFGFDRILDTTSNLASKDSQGK